MPEWDFVHEASENSSESDQTLFEGSSSRPEQYNQEELSDLMRDLNLSKEYSEVLASTLKVSVSVCLFVATANTNQQINNILYIQ